MAERAERERHYTSQAERAAADEAVQARRSAGYSRLRLALFLAALGLLLVGTLGRTSMSWPAVTAALVGFAAFAVVVGIHARVEEARARAVARRECAEISLARMARNWAAVPAVDSEAADSTLAAARAADLDVDGASSLMSLVGALTGAAGQRLLRGWLIDPVGSIDVVRARQEAARVLARNAGFREEFAAERRLSIAAGGSGLHDRRRFLEWAVAPPSRLSGPAVRWLVRVCTIALVVCLAGAALTQAAWTELWAPLALGAFAASFFAARVMHADFDAASLGPSALGNVVSLIVLAEAMPAGAPMLDRIQRRLSHPLSASDSLGSLARRIGWSELRRTAPILHLPLQALALWDFHVLFALDDWRTQSGGHAADWLDALAELDALVALGTLAHDEPAWAFPLIEEGTPSLTAKALGHPLISPVARVANDVQVGPPGTVLLVTGSNMAGKSTLLRSIGTNVMLANAGAPVCAVQLALTPLTLATSLRTGDSLAQGVSGYMAGLLALKQILDEVDRANARRHTAVLYLLDEILAGTNSTERRLAVREIARHLLDSHAIGALTTHDLALADEPTLRDAAVRVHFRETVESDDAEGKVVKMSFDYRLRPGLATSTNAMALLHALGLTRRESS
ncbi:MAG: hypothetical protein M3Q55_04450 [Acidobacteriota bacterium]|nr:hypothetical protein [Acidobacteriota bacterium]